MGRLIVLVLVVVPADIPYDVALPQQPYTTESSHEEVSPCMTTVTLDGPTAAASLLGQLLLRVRQSFCFRTTVPTLMLLSP
jgi:hypothetical protein